MKTQPETAPLLRAFVPGVTGLAESQSLFHSAVRLQGYAVKAALRYQIEALSFLRNRCEQDLKLVEDLTADAEFRDTFDVLSVFMQNAATDYATGVGKAMSISAQLASETAEDVREQVDATIGNMAAQTVAA